MKAVVAFLVSLCVLSGASHALDRCLVLGVLSHSEHQKISELVSQALTRGSICNHLRYAPNNRLTSFLKSQRLDGEVLRVTDYREQVQDVAFMVKQPILTVRGLLLSYDQGVESLQDLKGQTIGFVRGTHWAKRLTGKTHQIVEVSQLEQLPEMLMKERIAGFLINEVSWKKVSADYPAFYEVNVRDLSAHIYLLNKHKDLEESINRIIKNLDLVLYNQ
ncbi:MAG: transporter substrate-binding domain-containing protein [Methylocystaceae bacterium]|nr:transporter substrate-binding domain-containing protein [Methylocystaceae bacterium]